LQKDKTRQFTLHKQVQGKVKIELKAHTRKGKYEKSAEINFSSLSLVLLLAL
jgi:uncharacterized lipoprotein YajG